MTERNQVWLAIRDHVRPYGHFTRIESPMESGIPDVAYTVHGVSGWVENKLFDRGEDRCPTHLTQAQVAWARDEAREGGTWHLLGRVTRSGLWVLYNVTGAEALLRGEPSSPILRHRGSFPLRDFLLTIAPRNTI